MEGGEGGREGGRKGGKGEREREEEGATFRTDCRDREIDNFVAKPPAHEWGATHALALGPEAFCRHQTVAGAVRRGEHKACHRTKRLPI